MHEIQQDITIFIRGGRTIKVPLHANIIIPDIEIVEKSFEFGKITTLGNQAEKIMTVRNHSNIPAELVIDLRGPEENEKAKDGVNCLNIDVISPKDESIMHSVHPDQDEQEEEE